MPTTDTRTCGCRGATARTPGRRDPDCPLHGIDQAKLDEYHATTYTIPIEVVWPGQSGRSVVTTAEAIGCHTRAACWPDHSPGAAARGVAEGHAALDGLYVGTATMGHVVLDGQAQAGWIVYLVVEPPVDRAPEPVRPACRQCGDRSGRCRHSLGERYGR